MATRYVICDSSFLGAGDRGMLKATAEALSGEPAIMLDLDTINTPKGAADAGRSIREQAGRDDVVILSTGLDYIHPLAQQVKTATAATWLDIKLDMSWQREAFRNFPKTREHFQPVDMAAGLPKNLVPRLDATLSRMFAKFALPFQRQELPYVPVRPDTARMDAQAARFAEKHPDFADNPVVILLGSYNDKSTKRDIDRLIGDARKTGRPVVMVTSPRTEKQQGALIDRWQSEWQQAGDIHVHRFDAGNPAGNIYPGILKTAGDVAVTGDSLTMAAEAMTLGKRTYVVSCDGGRPAYYQHLKNQGAVRAAADGLAPSWQPSRPPNPFNVIRNMLTGETAKRAPLQKVAFARA